MTCVLWPLTLFFSKNCHIIIKSHVISVLSILKIVQFSVIYYFTSFVYVVDSRKVRNLTSVKEANSVLECIEILQDEQLFTQKDVIYMQFLCQEVECFDLFTKCIEYAETQKALCYFKKPLGKLYASRWLSKINNIIHVYISWNIKIIGTATCLFYIVLNRARS